MVSFRVVELGSKSLLIVNLPDPRSPLAAALDFDRLVSQAVDCARVQFDAIMINASTRQGLKSLPPRIRGIVANTGFRVARGKTKTGEDFGGTYWLLELRT